MKKDSYELSVKINGSKLPEYGSHGKTYIRGEVGREFTLQFRNNTANRVLARFSVDGLSVLDGKSADRDKSGYICDAYSSVEVAGWRTSLEEVRKFEFSSKEKSYAGKTISTSNCGVIGVQIFSEKQPKVKIIEKHIHHYPEEDPWYDKYPWQPWKKPSPMWRDTLKSSDNTYTKYSSSNLRKISSQTKGRSRGAGGCSAGGELMCSSADMSDEVSDYNLGTKFGDAKSDSVRKVSFDVGDLVSQLEIYYTDRQGLENAGINLDKKVSVAVHPQAFSGFCQPPDED